MLHTALLVVLVAAAAPQAPADLIVVEKNLFDIPARRLGRTRVLITLLEGVPVYENASPGK